MLLCTLMENWEYVNDLDIKSLPFLPGMSPSVRFPHSSSTTTTENQLDIWNDTVLSKINTSVLSTSKPTQTSDVIGETRNFSGAALLDFPFPEDFLAHDNIAQPLTELNNYFSGHTGEKRDHLFSNTGSRLYDGDSGVLDFAGNEMSLSPAPQSTLSPGSKENFCKDIPSSIPKPSESSSNEPFGNTFMPSSSLSGPVSSVKGCSKIITNKKFTEPNIRTFEKSEINSRQSGQQFIEHTVVIRKVSKNSRSCRSTATKSLIRNAASDQKGIIRQTLNKKHDLRKEAGTSKASLAKALGDHLYTLNTRSKSLPELPVKAETYIAGLKSLARPPSFLEAFLRCTKKLNPNVGSDELLNSEEVLRSVLEIRSVLGKGKNQLVSEDNQMIQLKIQGSQTEDSISYKTNANTVVASVSSSESVADNSCAMDVGEDNYCALPADVANLELHTPLLGDDTLLHDDFGLDIVWMDFDSQRKDPQDSGNSLTEIDIMIEHKDWFQEEQRQEDEYWKSYLNEV